MPRGKYITTTTVKHNGEETPEGESLDRSKFSDDEWQQLLDSGAIEGAGVNDPDAQEAQEETPEDPGLA